MTSGRFAPIATVATAVVSSAFLMLGPAGCDEEGNVDCGENCPPVEGIYPLTFQSDAGLPAECVNMNVQAVANGEPLTIQRLDGGLLTATLTDVALAGRVYSSGGLSLTGSLPTSTDGGVNNTLNVNAIFTGGPADGGIGSLSGTFTGNYSRTQGTATLRCTVARPFTATRL